MAKMIPNIFPYDSNSSGERKVFEYLKNNAPNDWYVLHSYKIPKHQVTVFGEADFVVIAPKFGVIILEIKSGGVGFDGDNWIFINRNREKTYKIRGPFQQGKEAMFEIERIITSKLGQEFNRINLLYTYGVIFADERDFPVSALVEDEPWRLMQKQDENDYCAFAKKLSSKFKNELVQLGKKVPSDLTSTDAVKISKTLRPLVDCVVPLKSFIEESEHDIITLTEEQYSCLDDIEINDQMVVTGGAGTGKTLLAVEQAKRTNRSEKVLFLCYNRALSSYIKNNVQVQNVQVYSLHSFMLKLAKRKQKIEEDKFTEVFYKKELPNLAIEAAIEEKTKYDRLIIDEFQDICTKEYLSFLDVILNKRLLEGKYTFYADFARQLIFNGLSSLKILKDFSFFARKQLSVNCRNTQFIGNEVINVTGYVDKQYRLKIIGEPVDYYVWNTSEEQVKLLTSCLKELKKKGFKSSSIMILSPEKREKSIVSMFDKDKYLIGDYGDNHEDYLSLYSTVQAFKGLESEIVILIDICNYQNIQLMYVALSRARSKLIVLESKEASQQRRSKIIAR